MYPEIDKNKMKKGLYIVSTPIGNLGDISFRAIETLKNSDFILCEDTRVSKKILSNFNIRVNLISNHKFNEKRNVLSMMPHPEKAAEKILGSKDGQLLFQSIVENYK